MSDKEEEGLDMSLLDSAFESEPEQVADEVADEEEVVDEVSDDEELPEDEAPQSDPTEEVRQRWDKSLQEVDQLKATLRREVLRLQEQGEKPTEKQIERVEKAQSKLEKLLGSQDVDPYQAPLDIAEEVLSGQKRADKALNDYELKIRALEEREARREAQMARLQFSADYPELRGRYDEFAEKTQKAMEDQFGDDLREMPANVFVKLANREFMSLVKQAASDSSVAEPKPTIKDSSKKPKATNLIKKKSGNSVQPPQDRESLMEAALDKLMG